MRLPLILLSLTVLACCAAVGAGEADLAFVCAFAALAALGLTLVAALRGAGRGGVRSAAPRRPAGGRRPGQRPRRDRIIVDGSNVMHWRDGEPDLGSVRAVVGELTRRGYAPIVWFDANAGWKTAGRYLGPREIAPALGLPRGDVRVVDKGAPADPEIIGEALRLGAPIVSNDQFRDWRAEHPRLDIADRLIPGGLSGEAVRLRMTA